MDDTSAVELEPSELRLRCTMCGSLQSEIELFGDFEAICAECKDSYLEYMYENSSLFGGDSDASVNLDQVNDHVEEIEADETTDEALAGRVQLNRSLATNGRNLPDDWLNEILSRESDIRNRDRRRVSLPNAGDYLDARGFEEFLNHLAETESSRLGPPPAAGSFVKSLEPVVVDDEGLVCVICRDVVSFGTVVNRLPCHHVYHPSCIVPWLSARNTCPVCRYELPTDDKEYERRRSGSRETRVRGGDHEDERRVQGGDDGESGGGRWWFVAAPIVSVVGIGLVLWFGGGVFGGSWASQRENRGGRRWWCLL